MVFRLIIVWGLILSTMVTVQEEKPVRFIIKNAGVKVRGSFSEMEAEVVFDPNDLSNAYFEASISVATINTGIKGRDKHLKKAKYFDIENYPKMTFISSSVVKSENGYLAKGSLTIKATTLEVGIPFTYRKEGGQEIFEGSLELDRRDYGVGKNHLILGDKVTISIYYARSR